MIEILLEIVAVGRGLFLAMFVVFLLGAVVARNAVAQTVSGSPDLVISQVYTHGGETGAVFRNDFIELFNRGQSAVDLADYSLVISTIGPGATPDIIISFVSSFGIAVAPGEYVLFQLGSGGNGGSPITVVPRFSESSIKLGSSAGKIAIVQAKNLAPLGCPIGQDPSLADYVAYGPASCAEGSAPATAPAAANSALVRESAGCTDTDNNAIDFNTAAPSPRDAVSQRNLCAPQSSTNTVQFETSQVNADESQGSVEIFVTRSGNTSTPASVQFATIEPRASVGAKERSDYTTSIGTLRFASAETRKSFRIVITDDVSFEGTQSLIVRLGTPTGGVAIGSLNTMTVNIIDNDTPSEGPNPTDATKFFVTQHYADFLSRDPDIAGLSFWTNEIDVCTTDAKCREVKRIGVSASFLLSIEFQETGFLVYSFFKAAYPDSASRPRGFPTYREFIHDAQNVSRGVIVGQGNWQAQLEANKQLAASEFVTRPEFILRYPSSMTAAQFIDALNANTGGALSQTERDALVTGLQNGMETRATVLRKLADDSDFRSAEFNRAFVLMTYFGYLRRNPNDLPDFNFRGYDFWLAKLNQFNGDFQKAEMVKAFLSSIEYRQRFGR